MQKLLAKARYSALAQPQQMLKMFWYGLATMPPELVVKGGILHQVPCTVNIISLGTLFFTDFAWVG